MGFFHQQSSYADMVKCALQQYNPVCSYKNFISFAVLFVFLSVYVHCNLANYHLTIAKSKSTRVLMAAILKRRGNKHKNVQQHQLWTEQMYFSRQKIVAKKMYKWSGQKIAFYVGIFFIYQIKSNHKITFLMKRYFVFLYLNFICASYLQYKDINMKLRNLKLLIRVENII